MKGIVYQISTNEDCKNCTYPWCLDTNEPCAIVTGFNTNDTDKCEACIYHEECERKSDPCWE